MATCLKSVSLWPYRSQNDYDKGAKLLSVYRFEKQLLQARNETELGCILGSLKIFMYNSQIVIAQW